MICAYFISLLQSKGKGEKAEEKGCHADWSCGAKSSSWVTPVINNIPNNQWHMYLQCQNHSLPSNYNHCRLDIFEKNLKLKTTEHWQPCMDSCFSLIRCHQHGIRLKFHISGLSTYYSLFYLIATFHLSYSQFYTIFLLADNPTWFLASF